ncbi:hypothetical protein QVD17_04749 [Tagetes erecta]|uniref:Uncharacterized protein n=1 Tax=Tagetes erecta TaxID=13708 RepID=A0AAD8LGW1_TARER|nr:hypothetical protein QVD17_04749 [Tagetes erecta]
MTKIPKTHIFVPSFTSIKVAEHSPAYLSLKTPPANDLRLQQEVVTTPNVPDFDPVPPEKPADPPPITPNPAPDFPGPPKPDPEIQPPGPDMPVPPNTPGGPEVVPPTVPEWTPPNPPEVVPQHPTPPEVPLPYA